jgi:hypothetical protein
MGMSVAGPRVQILVDWTNSPIGSGSIAGTNFVDISSYVRRDLGINITRGRQDAISAVQPGRLTFTVDNSTGNFTPQNSSSPWYPGVILGRRIQCNVADQTGTLHTRFDGQIAQININPAITGQVATAQIVCADVLAYLNRLPELSCWTVELSAEYVPALQYIMNEPTGSQGINDSSGNNGPVLAPYTYSPTIVGGTSFAVTAPTYAYQSGNSPVEGQVPPTSEASTTAVASSPISSPLPSIAFGGTVASSQTANPVISSAQFQGGLPFTLTTGGSSAFTVVCWVWPTQQAAASVYYQFILSLANSRTGSMLALAALQDTYYAATFYENYLASNALWNSPTAHQAITAFSTASFYQPAMVAMTVSGTTAQVFIAGNIYGTGAELVSSSTFTLSAGYSFNYLTIGGPLGGGSGFLGNISNVCVYKSVLSSSQLSGLGNTGAQGIFLNTTGGAASTLLAFTDLPSFWSGTVDGGVSTCDYVDITGGNIVSALQELCAVEHGGYYVDASGKLDVYDRTRRMGVGAPALQLPAGSYSPGIQPKWTDQYLINSEALQNERGGLGVLATNPTSIDEYGVYPNGTVPSPQTAPYYTWVGGYNARQVATPGTTEMIEVYNNQNITDAANWDVNTLGQPSMKLASVEVDMLSNTSGQNEYMSPSSLYGLEINSVISLAEALAWWPSQAESGELFIEGVSESYSLTEALISFYTSPVLQGRAWQPGSTAYGQLDVTARVGISQSTSPTVEGRTVAIPDYTSTMNLGAGANGYVGAKDQRGISENLQQASTPALWFAQQAINTQSLTSGTAAFLVWDTTAIDTLSGMGLYTNGVYIVQLQGWYEIYLTVQTASAGNNTGNRTCWIARNTNGSVQHIAPASTRAVNGAPTALTTSALLYLYQGDAVTGEVLQDSGAALATAITNGGSHMSLRYLGNGSTVN